LCEICFPIEVDSRDFDQQPVWHSKLTYVTPTSNPEPILQHRYTIPSSFFMSYSSSIKGANTCDIAGHTQHRSPLTFSIGCHTYDVANASTKARLEAPHFCARTVNRRRKFGDDEHFHGVRSTFLLNLMQCFNMISAACAASSCLVNCTKASLSARDSP
jgi:hypothetical protein